MKKLNSAKASRILLLVTLAAVSQSGTLAAINLIARGSLSGTAHDLSGLSGSLENGVSGDLLGGMGSGLAYAGGNTFLAMPDRGPNAVAWNSAVDDTSSYITRFQTMQMTLSPSGGALPYTVTPTLTGTTLFSTTDSLSYGGVTPSINGGGLSYFSGRSDNFGPGLSTNPLNGRLDPEGIRVSPDGSTVYVSDEYGPYVYAFDRATGVRERSYALPGEFAVSHLFSKGANEISGNTTGRVANKGMEGLAITPDGKTLVGFEQSPLIQDGGDGGRANRIVTIDVATGTTKEYAYDNKVGTKTFNSSEILALNSHQMLVLERDGKGLGDNSTTAMKSIYMVDLNGGQDVAGLSGEANLTARALTKSLFLDVRSVLNANGITDAQIPAKLEGMTFGQDVLVNGVIEHTLWIGNDNDFLATDAAGTANPNQWFVFGVSDADLTAMGAAFQGEDFSSTVPEANTWAGATLVAALASAHLRLRKRA